MTSKQGDSLFLKDRQEVIEKKSNVLWCHDVKMQQRWFLPTKQATGWLKKKRQSDTTSPPPLLMERKNSTQLNTYRTKKKTEQNVWEKLVKQNEINPNEVNRTKIAKNYSQAVMCAKLVSYQDSSVYYECNTYTLDDWYRLCNTVVMWNFLI